MLHQESVDAVDRHSPVEGVVDTAATDVGSSDVARHVEVDGITAESERLTSVGHLDVRDTANDPVFVHFLGKQHDVSPVLIAPRLLTKPSQETGLSGKLIWQVWNKRQEKVNIICAIYQYIITKNKRLPFRSIFWWQKLIVVNNLLSIFRIIW